MNTSLLLLKQGKSEMPNSVLFKVKVRDYIPLTAGHGDNVIRKEKLLVKFHSLKDNEMLL